MPIGNVVRSRRSFRSNSCLSFTLKRLVSTSRESVAPGPQVPSLIECHRAQNESFVATDLDDYASLEGRWLVDSDQFMPRRPDPAIWTFFQDP